MSDKTTAGESDAQLAARESEQVRVRRAKLADLREAGNAFPNDFKPDTSCNGLVGEFALLETSEDVEA
ncbi:MAG: lysine--tRNA ligase, partial [Candidatus Binatia bacterium]